MPPRFATILAPRNQLLQEHAEIAEEEAFWMDSAKSDESRLAAVRDCVEARNLCCRCGVAPFAYPNPFYS